MNKKRRRKSSEDFTEKLNVFLQKKFVSCYLFSLATALLVEIIARGSFVSAAKFAIFSPHIFFYNHLIIFFFFSIATFAAHRVYGYVFCGAVWIVLAITNIVLLSMRGVPFSLVDLAIFRYGIMLVPKYLSIWQLILIFAGVGLLIWLGIFLWRKGGKINGKKDTKVSVVMTVVSFLLIADITVAGLTTGYLTRKFGVNAAAEFERSGYPYSLICSSVTGMEKPEDYSESQISEIIDSLEADKEIDELPNIIFIQLESFFDMNRLTSVRLLKDPAPTFNELKKSCTNGYLKVPTYGGGTVNTEFEVLTQMSLEFFSGINYPYESFLQSSTCESIAYDLESAGYVAHAIHDYTGTFYSRHEVYKNLGFSYFTPLECMNGVDYNQLGWARDVILEKYVTKALANTPGPDLVFAVSVQGHGGYTLGTNDFVPADEPFVDGDPETDEYYGELEYYAEQVSDMDGFISSLIAGLEGGDEKTVVVLYGDHLPDLNAIDEGVAAGLYESEYVIWSNFDLPQEDADLPAYRLFSYTLEQLGMNPGLMTKYHQLHCEENDYLDNLGSLEYGLLYGERGSVSAGQEYHAPSDMKFGEDKIEITSVWDSGGTLYVRGSNFTESCAVMINGRRVRTGFINENCLSVADAGCEEGDRIAVSVRGLQNIFEELSRTGNYVYQRNGNGDENRTD